MIGLVYPTLAAILLAVWFGGIEPGSLSGKLLVLTVMTLAGGAEGATLGLFQARILTGILPGLRARVWVMATAIVAMIGWIVGLSVPLFLSGSGAEAMPEPPVAFVMLYAGGFGFAAGLLFGFGQWLVLRRYAEAGWRWILSWGVAWGTAMMVIFAAAGLQTETTPSWGIIIGAAAAGGVGGLLIGLISSFGVTRLRPRPNRPTSV